MCLVPIEFVYFDLGNVLVSFDPAIACRNLQTRFGVPAETADRQIYASGLHDEYEHGRITCRQYADQARQRLGRDESDMSDASFLDAISDMFTPIEIMPDVVADTRRRLGRVGLLSNTCHAHWHWIRRQRWPISSCVFDATVLSYEIGSMKPDAAIYHAASRAAGVSPERILFLDDKPDNVHAARRFGWNAEACVGGEPAVSVLRRWLGAE